MHPKKIKVCIWIGLLVLVMTATAWSQNPFKIKPGKKPAEANKTESAALPQHLNAENVDHIVAGLDDEQVRRLLIDELKAQARREALESGAAAKPEGIAGFIDKIKNLTTLLQTRIELLRSGARETPTEVSGVFTFLGRGERGTKTVSAVIVSVAAVLAAALLIEWLFVLYTTAVRRRIRSSVPAGWSDRIGALTMGALMDFTAIVVFILAALSVFFVFLDRTAGQRVLLATYLAAFVIVQVAFLASRFLLAPRTPALRLLPFSDDSALYLHRWLMALTAVISFGTLTGGVVRLAGASDLTQFNFSLVSGLIAAGMIIAMILQRRKAVAMAFSQGLPEASLRYRLARKWYHFAILGVFVLLAVSILTRLLGFSSGQAWKTLLMVPLYFLLDWILRMILEAAFGLVEETKEQLAPAEASADELEDDHVAAPLAEASSDTAEQKSKLGVRLELHHMKGPLRTALRLALAVLLFFWILQIWGISLPIGETVAKSVINILVVVLVCYVAWGIANAAILRRMHREMQAEGLDDEQEEGGAGGSRIGTLLMLLRKFMLVVIIVMAALIILSALGVNIGPLIAGAGVFGLAIGFGAQTLVKDIISGMFFLIDDAFRVGDYVECGTAKGTVVMISLRSLRLRHPRGMMYILPFGDIKSVTNLSRDYVIMKLDFRVRYDADVDKIRKIIKKKVYNKITEDPELGPKLLEPIKSQGVREMDDSAMIMRVKYKTKPGDQFGIRREVYRLMQEAFKEEGIEFAHRNVTVYMPPEVQETIAHAEPETRQQMIQAGAAAVQAIVQEEEEKKQAAEKAKK